MNANCTGCEADYILKACSGRTRGAKYRDCGAHFDRRVLAQVAAKSSHFFSRRAPADRRGKVSASST